MTVYFILSDADLQLLTKDEIIRKAKKFNNKEIIDNTIYLNLSHKRKIDRCKLTLEEIRNYIPVEYKVTGDVSTIEVIGGVHGSIS